MISPQLKALLDAIGKHEAPKGYGQIYGGAKGVPKDADVSKLSLQGVMDLQQKMLKAGSKSTACGRYQFIRSTFAQTVAEMGLFRETIWTPSVQDEMAVHLMLKRGLNRYLDGQISREDFANNLAKEWASLPVVTAIKGASRMLAPGQSYYAGDGLNKAFHKPEAILKLVDALKAPEKPVQPPPVGKAPMAPRVAPSQPVPAPVKVLPVPEPPKRGFWAWLFGRA